MVLLDLHLPGLDGFAVLELLRADPRTIDLPVAVFVTSAEDEQRITEQYPDRTWCLQKPLSAEGFHSASSALGLPWAATTRSPAPSRACLPDLIAQT